MDGEYTVKFVYYLCMTVKLSDIVILASNWNAILKLIHHGVPCSGLCDWRRSSFYLILFPSSLQFGLQHVQFESDCKIVIHALVEHRQIAYEFGSAIVKCIDFLRANPDIRVALVRKQVNRVAHTLARTSILHTSPHYFYETLYCITNLIDDK